MPVVSKAQWRKFGATPRLRPLLHKYQAEHPVVYADLPERARKKREDPARAARRRVASAALGS